MAVLLTPVAQAAAYVRIAAASIGFFDYVMTIPSEIRMWQRQLRARRVSVIFILYLLCRYIGLATLIILTYVFFSDEFSPGTCEDFTVLGGSFRVLLTEAAALVFLWRTWVIWNKSRTILLIMSLVLIFATVISFASISHQTGAFLAGHCSGVATTLAFWRGKWSFSATHLLYDTLAFVLASWRLIGNTRLGSSPVSTLLFHDGLMYFLCIMTVHIVNIYWFSRKTASEQAMTQLFSATVTMVCSQRIITSLNERVFDVSDPLVVSRSIRFASSRQRQTQSDWYRNHYEVHLGPLEVDEGFVRSFRVNVPSELVHEDDNQPQPTAGYPSKEEIETMEQAELDSRDITEGVQEHKDLDTKDNETNDPENMV